MNTILPHYLAIGASREEVDDSCPTDLKPYEIAYKERMKQIDYQLWLNGVYTESAVFCAIDKAFSGKKAQSKYIEEPLLETALKYDDMTEEEIMDMKIREAIAAEEKWSQQSILRGLPETQI
jgi:hypothetical protein